MNTIMKNCAECRYCGKTIRFMNFLKTEGVITVDAESTAPEDTIYDPERHVAHRPNCPGFQRVMIGVNPGSPKQPCNCGKKKNAIPESQAI